MQEFNQAVSSLVGGADIFIPQNAGLVRVAAPSLQEAFRFFAPVATEIRMQQIDHRPQMTAFFDIHLKEVP